MLSSLNPFVVIKPRERFLVLLFISLWALLIGVVNLVQLRADLALVYFAYAAYISVLISPLLFYQSTWGWFHPLIFGVVWTILRTALPQTPLYMFGLQTHQERILSIYYPTALNEIVVYSLLLDTLALIAMYAGYFSFKTFKVMRVEWQKPKALWFKLLIAAVISLTGLFILMRASGGFKELLMQSIASGGINRDISDLGGHHWTALAKYPLMLACIIWFSVQTKVVKTLFFWILFMGSLIIGYAVSGRRSSILAPLIIITFIWALRTRSIPYKAILVTAIVGLAVLGIGGSLRSQANLERSGNLSILKINRDPLDIIGQGVSVITKRSTENRSIFPILAHVPERVDFLYGRSYLSIPLALMPRIFWPEKPNWIAGRLMAQTFYGWRMGGTPVFAVGEAYWNFAMPGVLIIFWLWGAFIKYLACLYWKNNDQGQITVIYLTCLVALAPSSDAGWVSLLMIIFVILLLCGFPRIFLEHDVESNNSV